LPIEDLILLQLNVENAKRVMNKGIYAPISSNTGATIQSPIANRQYRQSAIGN
jgi:hypothetical protein